MTRVLLVLLSLAVTALLIAAPIAAAGVPDRAFTATGRNRMQWIVALILFAVLCSPIGVFVAAYYFWTIHPEVKAAAVRQGPDR